MAQLSWGMIGGGEASQIGIAHRIGAGLDGEFSLQAGALDIDAQQGREYAQRLGVHESRAYGDWQAMLKGEMTRQADDNRLDLVTVATPNATHHEIAKAFLEQGFHVLCEKPLTMTLQEARDLVSVAAAKHRICAVNFGYSGYPLVREMRAMVEAGEIGAVRSVVAEFAHGHHADAEDADNPRVRWRYDPAQAGQSAVLSDCGIHALHMACFVTGQSIQRVSADFASCISTRTLEDDALMAFRMSAGTVGRLWTSAIAIGRQHGLTLQVFGERGGLRWAQEQPNQLFYTSVGGHTQIIERGASSLSQQAGQASRVTIGHTEGMPIAFANIYADLARVIRQPDLNDTALYPGVEDGAHSVAVVTAAVQSAHNEGAWTPVEAIAD